MIASCSMRGGQGGTCNRAVCGLSRTLTASFLKDGEVIEMEAEIPARIHRGGVEAEMLKQLVSTQ